MGITTLSSREFNQDTSRAKKAATAGPVFITDRGKPAHVLLTIDEYRRLRGERDTSLLQALTPKNISQDFDFDPPKVGKVSRPADLD